MAPASFRGGSASWSPEAEYRTSPRPAREQESGGDPETKWLTRSATIELTSCGERAAHRPASAARTFPAGVPGVAESAPRASAHRKLPPGLLLPLGPPCPGLAEQWDGLGVSRAPGPERRAPSPEHRAGRPPLPGPGPRGSRLRPAARRNLDAAPGSARYKESRVPRVPPAARGYLPPGLCIQPPRLKFTLAGSAGSGFPPTHSSRSRRLGCLGPARALGSARLGRL